MQHYVADRVLVCERNSFQTAAAIAKIQQNRHSVAAMMRPVAATRHYPHGALFLATLFTVGSRKRNAGRKGSFETSSRPKGHFLFGNLPPIPRDWLEFYAQCARDYATLSTFVISTFPYVC
jgi:hypothetical protein